MQQPGRLSWLVGGSAAARMGWQPWRRLVPATTRQPCCGGPFWAGAGAPGADTPRVTLAARCKGGGGRRVPGGALFGGHGSHFLAMAGGSAPCFCSWWGRKVASPGRLPVVVTGGPGSRRRDRGSRDDKWQVAGPYLRTALSCAVRRGRLHTGRGSGLLLAFWGCLGRGGQRLRRWPPVQLGRWLILLGKKGAPLAWATLARRDGVHHKSAGEGQQGGAQPSGQQSGSLRSRQGSRSRPGGP